MGQFRLIPLALLMTVCATNAAVMENWYRQLEPEQNIPGKLGTELNANTNVHCSMM